ncbi:MAG: HAD hydrolase family protein [Erysipelotrichaceae bacterium]
MIKMIVTDLDGTLYSDIDSFDINRFYRIYEKLKKLNIRFVVASGCLLRPILTGVSEEF